MEKAEVILLSLSIGNKPGGNWERGLVTLIHLSVTDHGRRNREQMICDKSGRPLCQLVVLLVWKAGELRWEEGDELTLKVFMEASSVLHYTYSPYNPDGSYRRIVIERQ
jgi:hypothetical protein